jgi:hypothetical protein
VLPGTGLAYKDHIRALHLTGLETRINADSRWCQDIGLCLIRSGLEAKENIPVAPRTCDEPSDCDGHNREYDFRFSGEQYYRPIVSWAVAGILTTMKRDEHTVTSIVRSQLSGQRRHFWNLTKRVANPEFKKYQRLPRPLAAGTRPSPCNRLLPVSLHNLLPAALITWHREAVLRCANFCSLWFACPSGKLTICRLAKD